VTTAARTTGLALVAVRSECARAEQDFSRFGSPAQHNPPVPVAVGDDILA